MREGPAAGQHVTQTLWGCASGMERMDAVFEQACLSMSRRTCWGIVEKEGKAHTVARPYASSRNMNLPQEV
jgi:hypothetical protein